MVKATTKRKVKTPKKSGKVSRAKVQAAVKVASKKVPKSRREAAVAERKGRV